MKCGASRFRWLGVTSSLLAVVAACSSGSSATAGEDDSKSDDAADDAADQDSGKVKRRDSGAAKHDSGADESDSGDDVDASVALTCGAHKLTGNSFRATLGTTAAASGGTLRDGRYVATGVQTSGVTIDGLLRNEMWFSGSKFEAEMDQGGTVFSQGGTFSGSGKSLKLVSTCGDKGDTFGYSVEGDVLRTHQSGSGYVVVTTYVWTPLNSTGPVPGTAPPDGGIVTSSDPCTNASIVGAYCGQTTQFGFGNPTPGTPDTLYYCGPDPMTGGTTLRTEKTTPCAKGCYLAPPGQDDRCK